MFEKLWFQSDEKYFGRQCSKYFFDRRDVCLEIKERFVAENGKIIKLVYY